MNKLETQFIKASFDPDINQSHYLVMPNYERVMYDYIRRNIPVSVRARSIQANGYPHRFAEQKKLPQNAAFIAPNSAADYGLGTKTLDEDHGREFSLAYVKAMTSRLKYTYFEKRQTEQYGQFEQVIKNDMMDLMADFAKVKNQAIWTGGASSLQDTTSNEYCGLLTQITDKSTVASGTKIADAVQTHIAERLSDLTWGGRPTAIYANPISIDLLIQEERERTGYQRNIDVEITPGNKVPGIITQAGTLPLIADPYIPITSVYTYAATTDTTVTSGKTYFTKSGSVYTKVASPTGNPSTSGYYEIATTKKEHRFVMMNENLLDRIWFDSPNAMLFEIASPENPYNNTKLLTDKMVMQYDAYILRGAYAGFHSILSKIVD